MKRIISILSCIVVMASLSAQDVVLNYYAIDGSTWLTEYDRDKKERLLWDKVEVDLQAALVANRLGEGDVAKHNFDIFRRLFKLCKEGFESVRIMNAGKEDLQNAEFRFFLSQNGINARVGTARTGEPFNMRELSECFDAVLREYSFNAKVVSDLSDANGTKYNLDFILDDFSERMELVLVKIEKAKLGTSLKMELVSKLAPRYKAAKEAELHYEQKQNRRN